MPSRLEPRCGRAGTTELTLYEPCAPGVALRGDYLRLAARFYECMIDFADGEIFSGFGASPFTAALLFARPMDGPDLRLLSLAGAGIGNTGASTGSISLARA